ncbi:MAG: DNA oxidative demethylase AlkB [Acidocella sp.]|nr:DNA oxidative demethylase AlkB [Acidocella sp.]
MSGGLFPDITADDGLIHLPGFAASDTDALLALVADITARSPFRHMTTPWGKPMSVAMSNCGDVGWTADRRGYRYAAHDPIGGAPWPAMPELFRRLSENAATAAGFPGFRPDACLINRYQPGAQMTLHQDRDERDLTAPIVSVSLGLPAIFLWGGATRKDKTRRITLASGDVVVWGGATRLNFHGVAKLKASQRPEAVRINLTFRKARA